MERLTVSRLTQNVACKLQRDGAMVGGSAVASSNIEWHGWVAWDGGAGTWAHGHMGAFTAWRRAKIALDTAMAQSFGKSAATVAKAGRLGGASAAL
eukprot:3197790-Pyramimonas_sp.AAC.1